MTMKKKFLLLIGIFHLGITYAQVGINTDNPQGILHIDPNADYNGTDATRNYDDIIVTADGKLGLGIISPSTLMHIKTAGTASTPVSGLRLEDGNQGAGRILAANNNTGLATWKDISSVGAVPYQREVTTVGYLPSMDLNTNNYYYTGSYINLPQGRWMVIVITLISATGNTTVDTSLWVSSTFADASTIANSGQVYANVASPDIEGQGRVAGRAWTQHFSTIMGALIINNTTSSTKKYNFMMGETSTFGVTVTGGYILRPGDGNSWGEHNIIAFRIPS